MAKTIFEEMGGTYVRQGDYFIPCLSLPEEETQLIGIWGQRRKQYLRQNHRSLYINLLTNGKLNSYLGEIDEQAEEMFFRVVKQLAEKEGVTEKLKAENQVLWIKRMNNIRACAREIVGAEIIYQ